MAQYVLNIIQPVGPPPEPAVLEPVMEHIHAFNQELRDAGAWICTIGLHEPSTGTLVNAEGDEIVLSDGPYAEAKEFVGGLWVIEAADLDEALDWASKAARGMPLGIEVRPSRGYEA